MSYNYALADRGRTLATRPYGRQLREELTEAAIGEAEVVLDFADVSAASHSFADEFVAQLAEEVRDGGQDFTLALHSPSPGVERVVRKALERRGLDIPVVV